MNGLWNFHRKYQKSKKTIETTKKPHKKLAERTYNEIVQRNYLRNSQKINEGVSNALEFQILDDYAET